jgi:hypothetical protein
MNRTGTLLLLLATAPIAAGFPSAPTDEAEIVAVVEDLFDAMRAGDAARAARHFHPEARLQSVGAQSGAHVMRTESVAAFVQAIGAPRDDVWDERIWNLEVRVDDGLATAWMSYAFYLGDTFSHCGVNAFQLVRDAEHWRVTQITDTRRRDRCDEPV